MLELIAFVKQQAMVIMNIGAGRIGGDPEKMVSGSYFRSEERLAGKYKEFIGYLYSKKNHANYRENAFNSRFTQSIC
jgi:hypothetical protein